MTLNKTIRNLRDLQASPLIRHRGRIDSVMWTRIEILAREAEALGAELERRAGELARPKQPEELDPRIRQRAQQALVVHGD